MKWAAIIVAAGASRRAGFDKLAATLVGVPVLCHCVRAFARAGAGSIILVCSQERWEALRPWEYAGGVPLLRTDGGSQRQDSVRAGLASLPPWAEWTAVHDAARPLITPEGILRCLAEAQRCGAAACAHPVTDTLKRADAAGRTLPEQVNRAGIWGMETPQIFRTQLLRKAYSAAQESGALFTDEVSVVQMLGVQVQLVQAGENCKITLPGDLERAESFLMCRQGVEGV